MKRSNSAVRNQQMTGRGSGVGDLMKINPISIPNSYGKLFHFMHLNNSLGQNFNPPINAPPNWFAQVYKSIFRSYCYLNPVLNISDIYQKSKIQHPSEKIREALISEGQAGNEYIFEDIMACIKEYDVENDDIEDQKEQFSSLNKLMKISEIGSHIRVPISNIFNQEPYTNFWVVISTNSTQEKMYEENMLINYEDEPYNTELDLDREEFTTTFLVYLYNLF